MFQCHVCGNTTAKTEPVSEVFSIDGRQVLVTDIPALVCGRCGEATFSRETTEKIRQLVHGAQPPLKTVPLDVFAFSPGGAHAELVREKPAKKYGEK
jgi:HTH-type transcriptional regulator / antitoxin MqsA